jgi:tetratricopeptide (TPR) repeat protein
MQPELRKFSGVSHLIFSPLLRSTCRGLLLATIACTFATGLELQAKTSATSKPPASVCDVKVSGAKKCAQQLYGIVSRNLLQDRDTKKATVGFTQVILIDPKCAAAWFNLGVLAEQRQAWAEAQADFKKYLVIVPPGPDMARAARELQVLEPYVAGLAGPAQEKQAEYDASIARARIFLSKQLYREAISEAGHAQALDDSRWEAYAIVSLVMYKQHSDAECKKFADLALARTPPDKKDTVAKALVPQP